MFNNNAKVVCRKHLAKKWRFIVKKHFPVATSSSCLKCISLELDEVVQYQYIKWSVTHESNKQMSCCEAVRCLGGEMAMRFGAFMLPPLCQPFDPFVGNPFVPNQNRASEMVYPGVGLVVRPRVEPVECGSFFRFHGNSGMGKYRSSAKNHVRQVEHEGDEPEAAILDILRGPAQLGVEDLAVIMAGNCTPDPVVHNLIVLAVVVRAEEPEAGGVLDGLREDPGDVVPELVHVHHLRSPELGVGHIFAGNHIGRGLQTSFRLIDHGVDLLLADKLMEHGDFRLVA